MLNTQISPDTRALVDLFMSVPYGGLVSWAAMSAAIGRNIKSCGWLAGSAMKTCAAEHGAVFATERGKGYVRLSPEEAWKLGGAARRRIRKTAKRTALRIGAATARANDLSPESQRKAAAEITALGLIEHITKDAQVNATAPAAEKPLPVAVAAQNLLAKLQGAA